MDIEKGFCEAKQANPPDHGLDMQARGLFLLRFEDFKGLSREEPVTESRVGHFERPSEARICQRSSL